MNKEKATKQDWMPMGSFRAQNIGKLLSEREWCYFIPPQSGNRGFIPACVIENVQGYRMMSGNGEFSTPWYWGTTLEEAHATCDKVNGGRGISKERALEIVQSTMADFTREVL